MTDHMRFMSPHDLMLQLRSLPALAELSADELAIVAQNTRERSFRRGSYLLREGRRIESYYLVVEGVVRVFDRGHEYGVARANERVGLLSFLAGEETGVSAVAETDVLALEFDAELIYGLFEDNFSMLLHDLRGICYQVYQVLREMSGDLGLPAPTGEALKCPARPLDLVERLVLLRQSPPLRRTSLDALTEVARQMVEVRFGPGHPIWRQGDPSDVLYMLACGSVECVGDGGRKRFVMTTGMPLGAIEALCGKPRWYDAVARTDVIALRGDVEQLFDLIEDSYEMAMGFLSVMSQSLIELLRVGRSLLSEVAPPADVLHGTAREGPP